MSGRPLDKGPPLWYRRRMDVLDSQPVSSSPEMPARSSADKPVRTELLLAGVCEDLLSAVIALAAHNDFDLPDDLYNEMRSRLEQIWQRGKR